MKNVAEIIGLLVVPFLAVSAAAWLACMQQRKQLLLDASVSTFKELHSFVESAIMLETNTKHLLSKEQSLQFSKDHLLAYSALLACEQRYLLIVGAKRSKRIIVALAAMRIFVDNCLAEGGYPGHDQYKNGLMNMSSRISQEIQLLHGIKIDAQNRLREIM